MAHSSTKDLYCFREYAGKLLTADAQGNIQLGEIEHLIVSYLLNRINDSLSAAFEQRFEYLIGSGNPPLSSGRTITTVLGGLVKDCGLRETEAHDIAVVALSVTSFCSFVRGRTLKQDTSKTIFSDSIPLNEAIEQAQIVVGTYEQSTIFLHN